MHQPSEPKVGVALLWEDTAHSPERRYSLHAGNKNIM